MRPIFGLKSNGVVDMYNLVAGRDQVIGGKDMNFKNGEKFLYMYT